MNWKDSVYSRNETYRHSERHDIGDEDWTVMQNKISEAFLEAWENPEDDSFLDKIWSVSTEELPGLEISIIVDRIGHLYMSKGAPGFVSHVGRENTGMKIPLQAWIHTHPFGQAYFSSTDWSTINNWKPVLGMAIVLGKDEKMKWYKDNFRGELLCRTERIEVNGEEE